MCWWEFTSFLFFFCFFFRALVIGHHTLNPLLGMMCYMDFFGSFWRIAFVACAILISNVYIKCLISYLANFFSYLYPHGSNNIHNCHYIVIFPYFFSFHSYVVLWDSSPFFVKLVHYQIWQFYLLLKTRKYYL